MTYRGAKGVCVREQGGRGREVLRPWGGKDVGFQTQLFQLSS
jgi:hypothetical protein